MKKKENNLVEVKNLSYKVEDRNILSNVSFRIEKKDMVAVVGPNGAGKSTLMKLLIGLLNPVKGKVKVNGKIGYVPQNYLPDTKFPATVEEILNLEKGDKNHKEEVINSLGIERLLDKMFKDLSGGEQQRVMIALSLIPNPQILILDEPEVGIDKKARENFYSLLQSINEKYETAIMFVTHDTGVISDYFKSVLCISEEQVCMDSPAGLDDMLESTYGGHFHQLHHSH